jgi:DNA-binding IclR family transcriptional regulator
MLNAPHSSIVAVLYNLADLGYLSLDSQSMLFFPTPKLLALGGWLKPQGAETAGLGRVVETLVRDTGHTAALCARVSLFVNTLAALPGSYLTVTGPAKTLGGALVSAVPGLVILAQMEAEELRCLIRDTGTWMRETGTAKGIDMAATLERVEAVRRAGSFAGAHPACRGTEIIAYPAGLGACGPMALTAYIPAQLSLARKAELRQAMERLTRPAAAAKAAVPEWPATGAIAGPAGLNRVHLHITGARPPLSPH